MEISTTARKAIAIFRTTCKSASYLQDKGALTELYGLQREQRKSTVSMDIRIRRLTTSGTVDNNI
jgi:hypothetical protein